MGQLEGCRERDGEQEWERERVRDERCKRFFCLSVSILKSPIPPRQNWNPAQTMRTISQSCGNYSSHPHKKTGGHLLSKYKHENTSHHFVSSIVPDATFPLSIKFKSCGFNSFVLPRPLKEQCKRRERRHLCFSMADNLYKEISRVLFWRLFHLIWGTFKMAVWHFLFRVLGTVWQSQLGEPLPMHSVQQLELGRQLVGLLPLGGKFGSFFVIVMVWKIFPCVGVKSKRPKSIQVDLFTYCWCQGVHENACAQPFGWQMFVFPVPVDMLHYISRPSQLDL